MTNRDGTSGAIGSCGLRGSAARILAGQRDWLLAAIRQQVSSQTKILGGFLVVVEVGDQLGRDRAADANLHVFLALLQKFLQEKERAQPRIDQPEQLKRHAVAAAEIYGERAGSGLAHQASGHGVPCGIGDLRLADIPLRDFASGKHGQRAALAQPFHRLLQGLHIFIRRRRECEMDRRRCNARGVRGCPPAASWSES